MVVHERYSDKIKATFEQYYERSELEGILFDCGPLEIALVSLHTSCHYEGLIVKFDWAKKLNYNKECRKRQSIHQHNFLKNRIMTQIKLFLFSKKHSAIRIMSY